MKSSEQIAEAAVTWQAGTRFGRLVIVSTHLVAKKRYAEVLCDCGTAKVTRCDGLQSGRTLSCGCKQKENLATNNLKHGYGKAGKARHPMYQTWSGMVQRCTNPRNPGYGSYGGRGITMDSSWLEFDNFRTDMEPTWFSGGTLERENTNGPYTKLNCLWLPQVKQAENTRKTYKLEYLGQQHSVNKLAELTGVSASKLYYWLRNHGELTIEEILAGISAGSDMPRGTLNDNQKHRKYSNARIA